MKYCITLIIFLFSLPLLAQEVVISAPQKLSNKISKYKLIGNSPEGLLVYKWGDRYHLLEAFDDQSLQVNWSKELNLPKRTDVLEILPQKDHLLIFYTNKVKNITTLYAQKVRYNLKPVDDAIELYAHKRTFGAASQQFKVRLSPNKKTIGVYMFDSNNNGAPEHITYWVISNRLVKLLEGKYDFNDLQDFKQIEVNNEGDFYMLTGIHKTNLFGRTNLYESFSLYEHNRNTGKVKEMDIIKHNDYSLLDAKFKLDRKNNQVVAAGFYSTKANEFVYGYFYALGDLNKKQFGEARSNNFSRETLLRVQDKGRQKEHLGSLQLKKIIVRNDGGMVVIGESFFAQTQNNENPRYDGFYDGRDFSRQFSYEDIILCALHPDGNLHWDTVLKKRQYSENDQGYYSSFSVVNRKRQLHFIFNEEVSFDSNVKDIRVDFTGDYKVGSVLNSKEYQLSFAPRYSKQISFNEVMIPGFNDRNEFVISLFRYD